MPIQVLSLPLGPIQTNCYIVADDQTKAAAVIDPGEEAPRVLAELDQHGWQLRYVLLTHTHFDHIGGVADILEATKAPLVAHRLELPLLQMQGGAAMFGVHIRPCPQPDILIEAGQVIEAGSLKFEVLFVPGHTPGHIAFYCAQVGAVFSGDVLFQGGIGRTDFPGSSYADLMDSIKRVLFALPDQTIVYSGHGPATTLGQEKRSNPFLAD